MKRLDRSVVGAAAECGVRRAEVVAVDSAASAAVAAEVVVEDTPTEEADIHLAVTASQHGKSNS
jgi:2-phospho-L-lactate guanylyltransferase (CobY/MobA/RfbA family)